MMLFLTTQVRLLPFSNWPLAPGNFFQNLLIQLPLLLAWSLMEASSHRFMSLALLQKVAARPNCFPVIGLGLLTRSCNNYLDSILICRFIISSFCFFLFYDYALLFYAKDSLTVYSPSSNSKIIPLFEKVLSASDAGRIGRLVLPKACAEVQLVSLYAYFDIPKLYLSKCWVSFMVVCRHIFPLSLNPRASR